MIEIITTRIGTTTCLASSGPFNDEEDIKIMKSQVDTCLKAMETNLVIDLKKIQTMSGLALEALLDIQDNVSKSGGQLRIVNANQLLKDIFLITEVDNYIEVIEE